MLESKYVSDKHIMLKLCREVYAFKSEIFKKLWAEMLSKFQLNTGKLSHEFTLGLGLSFISPL